MEKSEIIRAVTLNADPGKAAAVERERARLMDLFVGVDQNKINFVLEYIRQLAWYNCQITDLQRKIEEDGITVEFQNGRNQHGLQSNPDLKALCDLQKLTSVIVKTLLPLVPEKSSQEDPFAEFRVEPISDEEKEAEYKRQMKDLELIRQGIKIYDE